MVESVFPGPMSCFWDAVSGGGGRKEFLSRWTINGAVAGDSPWGPSWPFRALRVLSMGSTAVVRATRLPVALSLDRRLPQALLAPLCGARVCTHAPVHTAQPRGRAAAPRWRGPWPPGLPPGSSTVTAPWNTDEPLSLPHATPFRLSALSKRRDRETRRSPQSACRA